ncbi:MAG TPA: sigma-70 family RNA polymerase sigma factor [Chryseolinea sp.]|nr:sigma-70 family RNA polymerase sigma factor [Chryseolinea sp.]
MSDLPNERSLLRQIAQNDRNAFKLLYTYYLDDVFRYVYLFTNSNDICEEIVQEVFVKIWESREKLPEVNSFRYYLYRCTKNLLIDVFRRNQRTREVYKNLKSATNESKETSDGKLISKEYERITQSAICYLPTKRKQIVEMYTFGQYSFDEIASHLCISKSVVKKQVYAGMNFIRGYIKKYGELDL